MHFKVLFGAGLLVTMLFMACHKGDNFLSTRPSGVLSKDKMIEVLVDLNLAEASLKVGEPAHNQPADSMYQKSQIIHVFEKNQVKPDDFDKSLNYYSSRVQELSEIYEEVINRLTAMEAGLKGSKTPRTIIRKMK